MKKFRRMMALLLAMVMVLSMGISAFAAGEGEGEGEGGETPAASITITNGEYDDEYYEKGAEAIDYAKHTYKAAQILKAEAYDDASGEYTGLSWGAQVTAPAALLSALQGDETWGTTFADYVTVAAEGKTLFTAASFAKAISGCTADKAKALAQVLKGLYAGQGTEITGTDPVALPGIGYYLIDDTTTSLNDDAANPVILAAVPGSNKIRIKADKPKQDKEVKENVKAGATWNEVSDYNIGDYVPYKITSKVPNADAYQNYTMTFTDQMSNGLTFADRIPGVDEAHKLVVKVGGEIQPPARYTLEITDDQNFAVKLPIKANGEQKFTAGADISIEFYGLLNKNAEIGLDGNPNKSMLTYNNNPDVDTSKTDTPWDTVITFTYELDVNKIDGATKYALPGAQFALKATTGDHAGNYVVVDADGKVTDWTATKPAADATDNGALLVADAEGNFEVIGLDDGTYTLEEIKAPAGYNPIQPITLVVKGTTQNGKDYTDDLEDTAANALTKLELDVTANGKTTTKEGNTTTGVVETTVENNSGATLPETGGMGTTLFYIVGAALVIGAGVVLVSRRRMGAN